MKYGQALEALEQGKQVTRKGWDGNGMSLMYVKGWTADRLYNEEAALLMVSKTADGQLFSWVSSQADRLAEDWQIVNEVT